ncbi:MAG: TIGR01906 family membrane protein [Eubacteriales bacterium]
MRKVCALFSVVATILAVAAFAVLCIQVFAFQGSFYTDEYAKSNTAAYVGVTQTELIGATDALLSYLQDKRDNLDFTANIGGETRQYYNMREKAHMVDVKNLYISAINVAVYGSIVAAALFALCFIIYKRKALKSVLFGIYRTCYVILGGFAILAVWAAIDFNGFWTDFHLLFFRNDLWLLDPNTSLMIRMFESSFFFDLVIIILLVFFGVVIPVTVASKLLHRRLALHESK